LSTGAEGASLHTVSNRSEDDFIRTLGLPFLAHLLRRISDKLVTDAGEYESEIGIRAPPRAASTLLLLRERGKLGVTEIADALRQSHPLVISWLAQLEQAGLVRRSSDPKDARRALLALTPAGSLEAVRMAEASERIGAAYARLLEECDAPIHGALWQLHDALMRGRLAELLRVEAPDCVSRRQRRRRISPEAVR